MQEGGVKPPSFFCAALIPSCTFPYNKLAAPGRPLLLRTKTVVYCSVDPFLSSRGKFLHGFESFQAELDELEIPCVWLSSRSRLQLDEPRRRAGHTEPFLAEDGCGVYLPEDYFHLKPAKTVRLGRFTCIPAAKQQPAAAEALESLSEDVGVPIVPLRSLSPRELAQNVGLPNREAELARQRDFDELFFFAGASEKDISRFKSRTEQENLSLREQGVLWSLAVGADIRRCIRELGDLYDRSLRAHANRFAIAAPSESSFIFPACDRGIRLTVSTKSVTSAVSHSGRFGEIPITAPNLWDHIISSLTSRG
jgi:predicted mannosyl-3-phosphoglycerate phosphatase (HAD superfamily)